MNCPHCQSNNFKKSGKTTLGYQRYICKTCGKTWSNSPHAGRPTKYKAPMSDAERARRYRLRKKNHPSPSTSSWSPSTSQKSLTIWLGISPELTRSRKIAIVASLNLPSAFVPSVFNLNGKKSLGWDLTSPPPSPAKPVSISQAATAWVLLRSLISSSFRFLNSDQVCRINQSGWDEKFKWLNRSSGLQSWRS